MEDHHQHHLLNQDEIAHLAHEMSLVEDKPEGRGIDPALVTERDLEARESSSGAQQEEPKPKAATPVITERKKGGKPPAVS